MCESNEVRSFFKCQIQAFYLLHFEDKALSVSNVEEEVANDGGGLAVNHLQARSEPIVAGAVHHLGEVD